MTTGNHRRIKLRGGNFLEDLPSSIPRYSYEDQAQFREVIDLERNRFQKAIDKQVQEYHRLKQAGHLGQEKHVQQNDSSQANQSYIKTLDGTLKPPNECILFSIPGPSVQANFLDRFNPIRFGRGSFDLATNLLLARMITPVHAQATGEFLLAVESEIRSMVGLRSVRRYAAATILGDEGSTGKEADLGWGPVSVPQGFPDKPTVTVEVAVSDEPHEMLERDVSWWLDPARGNANLMMTIVVDTRKPRITIDKWQRTNGGEIERTHQSVMSRTDDGRIDVTPGLFTIPLELLFRQPVVQDETELMIDEEALELLADAVWNVQEF